MVRLKCSKKMWWVINAKKKQMVSLKYTGKKEFKILEKRQWVLNTEEKNMVSLKYKEKKLKSLKYKEKKVGEFKIHLHLKIHSHLKIYFKTDICNRVICILVNWHISSGMLTKIKSYPRQNACLNVSIH